MTNKRYRYHIILGKKVQEPADLKQLERLPINVLVAFCERTRVPIKKIIIDAIMNNTQHDNE